MASELAGCRSDVDGSVGRGGTVLVEGVIPNPAQAFDGPVASHQAEEVLDTRLSLGEVDHVEAGVDTDPDIVEGREAPEE